MVKKKDRLGEINYNMQNLKMRIIRYGGCDDIDVIFEDGTISKNRTYQSFKKGTIKNINKEYHTKVYNKNKNQRIGEQNYNKKGFLMKIIKYEYGQNIIVEFNDANKTQVKTRYNLFKNGDVQYPYEKTVLNIASIGQTKIYENNKHKKSYKVWSSMITRCYSEKYHKRQKTYKDCVVCDEWLCYENFEKWFNKNYYEIPNEKVCLDKDILIKGNKIYSPETCCFVPQSINNCILYKHNKNYTTLEYITLRNDKIKYLANKYKNYINKEVYNILCNYNVGK